MGQSGPVGPQLALPLPLIAQIMEAVKRLPIKLQNSICWAIENYSMLEAIGKRSEMTPKEIQAAITRALEDETYPTLCLLYITKFAKESGENEET